MEDNSDTNIKPKYSIANQEREREIVLPELKHAAVLDKKKIKKKERKKKISDTRIKSRSSVAKSEPNTRDAKKEKRHSSGFIVDVNGSCDLHATKKRFVALLSETRSFGE